MFEYVLTDPSGVVCVVREVPCLTQRLSKNGHIDGALKEDPLQDVIMSSNRQQNGHPFAVPSERSRNDKSVGGRGGGGR